MALSLEEVGHIAELAKLQLADEEKALFTDQLSAILDHFDSLQKVNTDDVPPMTSAVPLDTVLREDEAEPSLPPEKLMANAPDARRNMFRVNAVLD